MNSNLEVQEISTAKWGLLGTLAWSVIIAIVFAIVQTVVIGVYVGINYGNVPSKEVGLLVKTLASNGTVLSMCTFSTLVICGCMILGIIKLKKGTVIKQYLGWKIIGLRTGIKWPA